MTNKKEFQSHFNPEALSGWEEGFDKKFKGYWKGRAIPDEIKFFIRQIIKTEREQAVKEVIELLPKEYEGELDDFSSGFNICRNEIELKINKLKAKYN